MRTLLLIALTLIVATGCRTTKEMRRANRAARHIEKAVALDPSIAQADTVLMPISIRTPEISSRIVYPHGIAARPAISPRSKFESSYTYYPPKTQKDTLRIHFEDDTLAALISITDDRVWLDYTVKPITVDTAATVVNEKLQPTRYVTLPKRWWEIALMWIGGLFLAAVAVKLIVFR